MVIQINIKHFHTNLNKDDTGYTLCRTMPKYSYRLWIPPTPKYPYPIRSSAWSFTNGWQLSHLNPQQGTSVKVTPITFATLTTYGGGICKARGWHNGYHFFCKQQTQQSGSWMVKSNMAIQWTHLQTRSIPTYSLMQNHFTTFWISVSSSSIRTKRKFCSLRSL